MTDEAYIAAYQKLASQYDNNQSSMGDHLAAVQKLNLTPAPLPGGRGEIRDSLLD